MKLFKHKNITKIFQKMIVLIGNDIKNKDRGSVLIIVIIISSILFSIGIAFAFILEKEVLRQIYSQRSQKALNIANSALECVLFNDFRRNVFSPTFLGRSSNFDCGDFYHVRNASGVDVWSGLEYFVNNIDIVTSGSASTRTYKFKIVESFDSDLSNVDSAPCAYVDVKKEERCISKADAVVGTCTAKDILSSVEVRGYFRCSATHTENGNGQVVRKIKVFY